MTVTYNSAATLQHFWHDWPADVCEWIVVDNASTDGSADMARSMGARVVQLDANVGFSAANNRGVEEAGGDVLGFLNPDIAPTREGIARLATRVTASSALVAPQLTNQDGSLQENGRGAPYPWRKLAHMFAPASKTNSRYVRHVDSGLERVVWVMGAAVFMSRDVFDAIGGWDEGYFIYYEDSDICLRALRVGVPTYVDGEVRWVHGWARETAKGGSLSIWKHEVRSGLRFYRHHFSCVMPLGSQARAMRSIERPQKGLWA
ncbi:glycosyltransferase family 2 protein [Nocardioides sp. Soil805]|uniref:glycosyltransferase family 2 protein n=1 Tax=Nocardioides sp. Soil805 TaxID=1736416 RepID=UPI00138F04C7|nr:glycosyltransferase family 2 protein [Nocardioides sp. Soil805]